MGPIIQEQHGTGLVVIPEVVLGTPIGPEPGTDGGLKFAQTPYSANPATRHLLSEIPARWLREGTGPLLLAVDGFALVLGVSAAREASIDALLFAATLLGLYHMAGLYRARLNLSLLDDIPLLVGNGLAAYAVTAVTAALFAWAGLGSAVVERKLIPFAIVTFGFVVLGRAASYAFIRALRRNGLVAHRTLILGAGQVGVQVADALAAHPEYGLLPMGFIDSDPLRPAGVPLPVFGGHSQLAKVLAQHNVRATVIAFTSMPSSAMVDVIRTCDRMRCEIFIVPRLFEMQYVSHDMDNAWGVPFVRLRRACYRTGTWRLKRAMDIVVSAAALLVCALPMALAALAVRLEGGPGILFRQERVGLDGVRFTLLKFRSLKPLDDTESGTHWNIAHDDRLGPVGRFVRKTSIDELPQLFNILRGDMSLVGPRPERPHFVEQFTQTYPRYLARHRVPCGLTGWAQVHGLRGDTSIEDRARFDNHYIENWSLWLDTKILIRTLGSVIRREGA